jgi:hypothetical protein
VDFGHHLIVEEKEQSCIQRKGLKEQSVSFWMLSPEDMDSSQNAALFFFI